MEGVRECFTYILKGRRFERSREPLGMTDVTRQKDIPVAGLGSRNIS